MTQCTERGVFRGYIKGIFERATIQGISDYLLFGCGPERDERSYEERLDEPYRRFATAVAKYDKNVSSELLDLSNEVTSETASGYMEIGLQIGFHLAQDMIKIMNREKEPRSTVYSQFGIAPRDEEEKISPYEMNVDKAFFERR